MSSQLVMFAILATWNLAMAGVAQAPVPQQLPPSEFALEGWHGAGWAEGVLYAGSDSHKAAFHDSAVEFTPAFGSAAPRNYPVTIRLESIWRGSAVVLERPEPVRPMLDGDRVTYQRAAGIVERYDNSSAGIEQSFVFAQELPGSGDLVVRLALDTDLEGAAGEHLDGVRLRVPEFGGVDIGAVTGIDAEGRTVKGHLNYDGSHLELVLPGSFVEHASYPLVLDPLIGSVIDSSSGSDNFAADSAYDLTEDVYYIVFQKNISATDVDIWCRQVTGGGVTNGVFPLVATNFAATNPAIANVNATNRFGVAWVDDRLGSQRVFILAVEASGTNSTPVISRTSGFTALFNGVSPDIGGDSRESGPTTDRVVVVWDGIAWGIVGASVSLGTAPLTSNFVISPPGPSTIARGVDPAENRPAISKACGPTGVHCVAWEGNSQIISYRLYDTGMNVQSLRADFTAAFDVANPDVDGDGSQWLIAYERRESSTSVQNDLDYFLVDASVSPGSPAPMRFPPRPFENDQGDDEREPAVAMFGPMFAVAWSDNDPGSTAAYHIDINNVDPVTGRRCGSQGATGTIPALQFADEAPSLCSKFSAGAVADDEGLLTWNARSLQSSSSTLASRRYEVFGGGPVTTLLPGCGTGGTCGTRGPAAIGNLDFAVTLTGADPTSTFGLLLADAFGTAAPPSCGSCTRIDAPFVFFVPITGGQAERALRWRCGPAFIGLQIDAQWLTLSTSQQPCPTFPELQFSNAIRIVIAD